ncbi:putative mynd domain protein [Neofusicoccum parvum UCRNP2]|uniref:Putative mynd domain protein n=1 Tax=Botryosphaeria parva (strain UCR-NP2) TaxID=1287680 RepID=R1EEB6_BOTPV|nr:putative mynd domain protein [Neofusicoccum parvum UCRNP2]
MADSTNTRPSPLISHIHDPFTCLDADTWLHDRPECDVYTLLIDAFRLRMADEHNFKHRSHDGSIYAGDPDSLTAFKQFLHQVKQISGLLPPWWSEEKRGECIVLGMNGEGESWRLLAKRTDEKDIAERYEDKRMPLQMRVFAKHVCGPGAANIEETADAWQVLMRTIEGEELQARSKEVVLDDCTV